MCIDAGSGVGVDDMRGSGGIRTGFRTDTPGSSGGATLIAASSGSSGVGG